MIEIAYTPLRTPATIPATISDGGEVALIIVSAIVCVGLLGLIFWHLSTIFRNKK